MYGWQGVRTRLSVNPVPFTLSHTRSQTRSDTERNYLPVPHTQVGPRQHLRRSSRSDGSILASTCASTCVSTMQWCPDCARSVLVKFPRCNFTRVALCVPGSLRALALVCPAGIVRAPGQKAFCPGAHASCNGIIAPKQARISYRCTAHEMRSPPLIPCAGTDLFGWPGSRAYIQYM